MDIGLQVEENGNTINDGNLYGNVSVVVVNFD